MRIVRSFWALRAESAPEVCLDHTVDRLAELVSHPALADRITE